VASVAEETQTDPAMVGPIVLAALSTAAMRKFVVRPKPGTYAEAINLYVAVSAGPSERKSPVYKHIIAPIEKYECDEVARLREQVAIEVAQYDALKQKVEAAKRDAAKLDHKDPGEAAARLEELVRELERSKPPSLPRWLVDDSTPEALENLLAKHGGRIAILTDEGGDLFAVMSGRYQKDSPNLRVYLKSFSGEQLRCDRTTRETFIERPSLTIGVMTQPSTLEMLAKNGLQERGLPARILYAIPCSRVGRRVSRPSVVPPEQQLWYDHALRKILALPASQDEDGNETPHALVFSPEAEQLYAETHDWLEPQLPQGGKLEAVTEWGGKLLGKICRIAGLFHLLEHCDQPAPWEILVSADAFERAVALGEFFIAHAKVAFGLMEDSSLQTAQKIVKWLQRENKPVVRTREVHRGALRCKGKREGVLDPALAMLVVHRYLEPIEAESNRGRGRPIERYRVNPYLLR
jgi:hypothetical protein